MMDHDERFALAVGYAGAFSTMSRLFWVPLDENTVGELADGEVLDHLAEYCVAVGSQTDGPIARLREAVAGERAGVTERLNVESTRLFRTAVGELPASPYESVWTDGEGLLGGPSTARVAQAYREAGLTVAEDVGAALPDHVSRELEFLAHATRSEARALDAGDQEQAEVWRDRSAAFFKDHAQRWLPEFFQAIIGDESSMFFGALARVGLAVLGAQSTAEFFSQDDVASQAP